MISTYWPYIVILIFVVIAYQVIKQKSSWLEDNAMVVYGATGVLILIGIPYIMIQLGGKDEADVPRYGQAVFIDPKTKNTIRLKASELSPYQKDGVNYYKIQYYACGECGDESKYFIGYMQKYTEKAYDILKNDPAHPDAEAHRDDGIRYALPEPDQETGKILWTDDVGVMLSAIKRKCKKGQGKPTRCAVIYKPQ